MIHRCRTQLPAIALAIFSLFSIAIPSVAQVIPLDQNFESHGDNVISTRRISVVPGPPDMTYSFVSPVTISGPNYMSVGVPSGSLFGPGKAFTFNLGAGGVIPGTGQVGTADFRIHFTSVADTNAKIGNYGLLSMYLAIGAGNSQTVTIQGFRAGALKAQAQVILSSNSPDAVFSATDLSYVGTDAYSGATISFGTNWQFLDGLRFTMQTNTMPLSIDDIDFGDPVSFSPGTQASAISFNNNTGVSAGINWVRGSGDSTIVFIKQTNTGAAVPSFGTYYTANSNFGVGAEIGSSGWYCIYKGKGATTTVSNLSLATAYRVMAISYNGSFGHEAYNTGVGTNIGNFTTLVFPLPVDFGNMEAKALNCKVQVSFETFTETNNSHFVIERSRDGNNWDSIVAVQGRGTSVTRTQYRYTDHFPLHGKSYYRIRQVDEDHRYKYSKILLVKNDCLAKQMIQVYPNPAKDNLQVVLLEADDKAAIFLYDMVGQRISPVIATNANRRIINTTPIPNGTYLLKVVSLDNVFTEVITVLK